MKENDYCLTYKQVKDLRDYGRDVNDLDTLFKIVKKNDEYLVVPRMDETNNPDEEFVCNTLCTSELFRLIPKYVEREGKKVALVITKNMAYYVNPVDRKETEWFALVNDFRTLLFMIVVFELDNIEWKL